MCVCEYYEIHINKASTKTANKTHFPKWISTGNFKMWIHIFPSMKTAVALSSSGSWWNPWLKDNWCCWSGTERLDRCVVLFLSRGNILQEILILFALLKSFYSYFLVEYPYGTRFQMLRGLWSISRGNFFPYLFPKLMPIGFQVDGLEFSSPVILELCFPILYAGCTANSEII